MRWQRRVRLLFAIFAVAFAVVLTFAFKKRAPAAAPSAVGLTDPEAVVESTSGRAWKVRREHEDVTIDYERQLTYKDGSTKLIGVKIVTTERNGARTFTITAKEGFVGQNESAMKVDGAVQLAASDGLVAKTEHATYAENDGMVRADGPVEFTRGRLRGPGVGMTYDKNQDVLVVLDQAHVVMGEGSGHLPTDITAPTATLARREKYVRFERGVKTQRGGQLIESDNSVAHLTDDERLESVELRGSSKVTASKPQPGALERLTGRDMDLKYAADGETLERATITGDAALHIATMTPGASRQVTANVLDVTFGSDGTTPTALVGREAVQLVLPAEQGTASRTIKAWMLDATGDPEHGLTGAALTGSPAPACLDRRTIGPDCDVEFRERDGSVSRTARAATLALTMKPGMSGIEEAKFTRNVRFEEGKLTATAASARYVVGDGTLDLSGGESSSPRPHVVNDQISIDAAHIDVTLDGPKMKATGDVQSVLQPKPKDQKSESKTPSMLKADQPVNIVSADLDYDGSASKAVYTGNAKLWQSADTSVQGQTLTIDNKHGDMSAAGSAAASVTTSAMLKQRDNGKGTKKDRIRTIGTAKEFKYEESSRKATYSTEAHLSGPQGDITSDTIELYLQASGDEVERAEAYGKVTLREQDRKTTGERLTYTSANDTYLVNGAPLSIVDACGRETVGKKLTFLAGSDTVIIDSGGQSRTQTTNTGKCP